MKKTLSLLLTLCLLLGALPAQALALAGDILPAKSGTVEQVALDDGSLSLQNEYLHVTLRNWFGTYSFITVVPAAKADEESLWVSQAPYCNFITYDRGKEQTEGVVVSPEKAEFVTETPNGSANAIKVEYALLSSHSLIAAKATVYYELVQLKEDAASADDTWGVLASVGEILVDKSSLPGAPEDPAGPLGDFAFTWGYALSNFTAIGHISNLEKPGGPAIKMTRTTVPETAEGETPAVTSESSVFTAAVENLDTKTVPKGYSQWGDVDGVYITEVYTDGYPWANPFVGLSDYYEKEITSPGSGRPIRAALAQTVSVKPGDKPLDTWVMCESYAGFDLVGKNEAPAQETDFSHFLWGFHGLMAEAENVPTKPDEVDPSIYAKRLAVFANGSGVTVEYVENDAALEALKKQYGASPAAIINGDYESANGETFTFTGGAALLSPSVTAAWDTASGRLVIRRDGTVEQNGVHLSAPTFKFYQPERGAENALKITLTEKGFQFDIDPEKNEAIVFLDIPYAAVKVEQATADAAGNLVFGGSIGFQTVFNGAEFSMEKLGYGLAEKTVNGKKTYEFKVNGVHAKGSFDTEKLMTLELASIEGEVNTFKGEERYAFSLELNAFDLFETEASLALERSKKDGSLIPDELWFYVKASPGIPLVPPIPIGQLNGGGAGFKDLAATVNGNYFAIPPLKLRGALTGTYLHLIEGTGNVVLGPSEISLKATDVGIVGAGKNGQIIESFGYSLQLSGQERTYGNETYKGLYFVGSEELALNLPSKTLDIIVLNSAVKLGAFGGVNDAKDRVYLGVGANGIVKGRAQVPSDVPIIGGVKLASMDIDLVVGGQTTIPIRGVSVSEGMKAAFDNVDIYLGAMFEVDAKIIDARVWVLVPQIVQTNFRRGGGWDVEHRWFRSLPEWNWEDHGVTPVVQAMPMEDGAEDAPALHSGEPSARETGGRSAANIKVETTGQEDTPYIVLAFDNSVTDEEIRTSLSLEKDGNAIAIKWIANDGDIDPDADSNGTIVANMKKAEDDGKEYRMVILRLKEGGDYSVSAGGLSFSDEKGFAVEPFAGLALTQSGYALSGEVAHPETGTTYVLRTYLGSAPGETDYLVDERTVAVPYSIAFDIPATGALAPTGEYYATSFLMAEKSFTLEDGTEKTALAVIDSQQFTDSVSYTNTNQPEAPASASLTFTGNEVMRAAWQSVGGADGYRVTIYQQDGADWVDTGFGYDLDAQTTSIDMALTVGGEETPESRNLSANQTYKVGVSAYTETEDGGKYYSAETESGGEYLPEYTPLELSLAMNGMDCAKDEYGVYHAYVGGSQKNMLAVSCAAAGITYKVTRMDKTAGNEILADAYGEYEIPAFNGSLMFQIDGISAVPGSSAQDVTSVFLLMNMDETPPVLTLSDPIFYADADSGAYAITGMADAGSLILYGYGENETVYTAGDGSFTVTGTLDDGVANTSLYLCAKDSAGNLSPRQLALVARQAKEYSVTVNGSYAQSSGAGDHMANSTVTVRAGTRSGYTFSGWTSDSGVTFADASAAETTFTMPDKNVTVTANWVSSGSSSGGGSSGSSAPTYPVNTPDKIENGTVTVSPKNASRGNTVTVTVKPDSGYVLGDLTVTDSRGSEITLIDKGDGKYTFVMPAGQVDIKASFTAQTVGSPFDDVPTDAYYYEAVKWAAGKGITGGIGNNLFGPDQPCTRAQIVTFLWRAAGAPEPKGMSSFADVPADSYYAKAAAWAVENGVTTGTGGGKFSPDAVCTRAQAVTFLARALHAKAAGAAAFSDVLTGSYFAEAVAWAAANGVTTGIGGGLFGPDNACTRAQIVTFLYRAYNQ